MREYDLRIAELEAQVAELEQLLKQRSRELREIQCHLDRAGLLVVSRVLSGLPPLPQRAHNLELWEESSEFHAADVEDSMKDLWHSLGADDSSGNP